MKRWHDNGTPCTAPMGECSEDDWADTGDWTINAAGFIEPA